MAVLTATLPFFVRSKPWPVQMSKPHLGFCVKRAGDIADDAADCQHLTYVDSDAFLAIF